MIYDGDILEILIPRPFCCLGQKAYRTAILNDKMMLVQGFGFGKCSVQDTIFYCSYWEPSEGQDQAGIYFRG